MALTTFSFSQITSNFATAAQASAKAALNFTIGSVFLAIAHATSGVVLWLQAIILQLLTLTRASTSIGTDLDSWCADYGFNRLSASASTGQVTFSRFTATMQAVVPIGAGVQTADGTQAFTVILDITNSAYNAGLGGYVLPVNTASVNVPVQAAVAGSGGNVQAATITALTTPVTGVDTVTNAASFINGVDAESDAAFRLRFVAYLSSLSKGIRAAIAYAVSSIQQVVSYTITENTAYNGAYQPGFFYVVCDDGTGFPPTQMLTNVGNAVEAVRGLTITYGIFAPIVETANVTMVLTSATGFAHGDVIAAVALAITNFINALPVGASLPYTQLASIAYDVAGVANVTGILLNAGTSDLTATSQNKINCGILVIS
jgi:uncharacterized phage protein gp47/JayE